MYQAHFGLKKGLFDSGIAQGTSVFLGAKQQLVVANSKVALTTLDSVVVLTGAAGVGKTTIASAALRESSTRLALGWLGGIPANASELLEQLLVEFGLDPPRAGRMERLQLWRQFLNETNATDSRVFVIVEHADDLSVALLRALESFTAADPNGCAGANVVLLGEQTLAEQLKSPALDSLRQRVRLRQKLEPLSVDELRAYLGHHVASAGGVLDNVFSADAVTAIHRYTSGIPRLVNNLCETALTLAATRSEQQVAADLVAKVATDLLGLDEPASAEQLAEAVRRAAPAQPATPAPTVQPAAPARTAPEPQSAAAARSAPEPQPAAAQPASIQPVSMQPASLQPASTQPAPPAARTVSPTAPAAVPAASRPTVPTATPLLRPTTHAAAPTRSVAPPPAAPPAAPAPAAAKPAPAPRTLVPAKPEFDGDETDIVVDELLTDTLIDETPDVQMAEFPVLTDAVDAPAPRARQTKPDSVAPVAKQSFATTPAKSIRPASPVPPAKTAAPPRVPDASAPPVSKAASGARPPSTKPASPNVAAESEDHETKTMRALATAKSIDDISNSMAETLFGEADLDMLSSALAAGDWSESDDDAAPAAPAEKPRADDSDGFDLFDLGPDAPLELIDDSSLPPQPQVGSRKRVNDR
ncbi:MAG TPA: AAA family ATPase [Gammaproteobacteria bacterium]|nr:AAA family ATPase [Gammaproteobacteria bacterium]